jgi:putative ABC transport system permease protein
VLQDLRYAARLLTRSPSFSAVALATLALGIAANTAIFSIVNAVLLRPLPYPGADRLVMLWQDQRARGGPANEWLGPAHFFDWRTRSRSFEASAVFRTASPTLTGMGEPEQLRGWQVTAELFRTLGITPALGRDFQPEDDRPGAPGTAILTHGLWVRRFGGDRSIVGQTIVLDRTPHTVIGVLPPSFRSFYASPEIFRPAQLNATSPSRRNITLRMVARLKGGVPFEQAQAEMRAIAAALAVEHPQSDAGTTIRLTHLHDEVVGEVRAPLLVLMVTVLLVMAIACANVAGLQLARASARTREMAVRTALGAGRMRIVRQLLTESLLLGLLGAAAGVVLSSWMLDGLTSLAPEGTARLDEVRIDVLVLAFAVGLALITSVVFGLAPSLHGAPRDAGALIRDGQRGAGTHRGAATRSVFVVAQLALALALLVGAGLLMRSLANLRGVDPGFDPARLLTGTIALPANGYEKPPHIRTFYAALLERLQSTPAITGAALVSVLPFSGVDTDTAFLIEGRPEPRGAGETPTAWHRIVSASYLRTIGMQMERGRFLEPTDVEASTKVVVINRTLANTYWRNEDPVGKRILAGKEAYTIVGVVRDVHHRTLNEAPRGQMFLSYQQAAARRMSLVLKTASEPPSVLAAVRQHLAAVDPNVPLSQVATMDTLMADTLAVPRMLAILMGGFAAVSLLLAAIGVYGLIAYTVTLRTAEFGIRIALGASGRDVLRLVLSNAARLTVAGIVAGALAAGAGGRFLSTLLFGITPSDARTFAATAVLLAAIALLASYLPARRAVKVDPVAALRSQ